MTQKNIDSEKKILNPIYKPYLAADEVKNKKPNP